MELLEDRLAPAIADVAVTLTGRASEVQVGISLRIVGGITIEVVNNGPEAVSNVAIRETTFLPTFMSLPIWNTEVSGGASVSPTSGSSNIIATASLPVGGKVKLSSIAGQLTGGFTSTATVTLDPGDTDPNLSNNTVTITVPVTPAQPPPSNFGRSLYATGTDAGVAGHVKVYDAPTGQVVHSFLPFGDFRGGVRVSTGDITGDGFDDIVVGAGPGAGPHVKVYDGRTLAELASFFAFDPAFSGGVFVAAANFIPPPPAFPDIPPLGQVVVGADAGAFPHVRTFSLTAGQAVPFEGPLGSFMAYDTAFRGGVRVAAANVDGLGVDELITGAGPGAGPHVKAFRLDGTEFASFLAYGSAFQGGVYVAGIDFGGDGTEDIVTGAGALSHVKVFGGAGLAERASFLAFGDSFAGGVRVAGEDRTGDGFDDLVLAAGPGAGPHVKVLSGLTLVELDSFFAYDPSFSGGVLVG